MNNILVGCPCEHRQRLFLTNDLNTWVPGGTPDFKWRGWSKFYGGFEIFDSGNFGLRKFWFTWVFFLRIQNNLKLSFCIMLLMKQKMFLGVSSVASEKAFIDIRHGYFFGRGRGLIFVQGFLGFCKKPYWFFFGGGGRVDFCPHSSIPVTWNPEYPVPWELGATEGVVTFKITTSALQW